MIKMKEKLPKPILIAPKFKREYVFSDSESTDTWTYNDKGFLEVKIDWDKRLLKSIQDEILYQESLPKSKRKYLNPENGKFVGYARARDLGFFED
jgi:hypothetical protein